MEPEDDLKTLATKYAENTISKKENREAINNLRKEFLQSVTKFVEKFEGSDGEIKYIIMRALSITFGNCYDMLEINQNEQHLDLYLTAVKEDIKHVLKLANAIKNSEDLTIQ